MKLTRRALLAMLALAALDPERLLWVPGKKLISIPKPVSIPAPTPVLAYELFRTKISAESTLFCRALIGQVYRRHDGSFVAVNDSHCDIQDVDAIQGTLAHIRHTAPLSWPSVYSRTNFHPRPTRLWEAVPVLSPPLRFRTRAEDWEVPWHGKRRPKDEQST